MDKKDSREIDEQGLMIVAEAGLIEAVRFYPHEKRAACWELRVVYGNPSKERVLVSYRKKIRGFRSLSAITAFSESLNAKKIEFILKRND